MWGLLIVCTVAVSGGVFFASLTAWLMNKQQVTQVGKLTTVSLLTAALVTVGLGMFFSTVLLLLAQAAGLL